MAQAVAMNAMYLRLGFSGLVVIVLRVDQGMENLDKLELIDDTEVEALCKLVRRQRGQISNPNVAGAGRPALISAQGNAISIHLVSNLKHTCFFVHH